MIKTFDNCVISKATISISMGYYVIPNFHKLFEKTNNNQLQNLELGSKYADIGEIMH